MDHYGNWHYRAELSLHDVKGHAQEVVGRQKYGSFNSESVFLVEGLIPVIWKVKVNISYKHQEVRVLFLLLMVRA